jgi:transposase InsO family protein
MNERITKDLVMQALFRAVSNRHPKPGLILHTDRGSQHCLSAYQKIVRQFGMRPSMSRRGNCNDNTSIESFSGALKSELIYHRQLATREQARLAISEYIEMSLRSGPVWTTYRLPPLRSDSIWIVPLINALVSTDSDRPRSCSSCSCRMSRRSDSTCRSSSARLWSGAGFL